ncbi:MAG: DNA-binding protein [Micromonosporaceae bacterium]|nr:DNA-binding protein [Micromonosporaceae bacterium]
MGEGARRPGRGLSRTHLPNRAVAWQGVVVTDPVEPAQWLSLADVAERLQVPVNKVHQMVRDRALLAVRRDGALRVPAELVANRTVLKHLPGVLTLLYDAGYSDEEALRWLYRPDDSLPGTAAQALSGDGATEVKRRAQAVGF